MYLMLLQTLIHIKATGIDHITPSVLKSCACTLTLPLHHYLFTISLNTSTKPNEWKMHKIIPVYKSSDKASITNYRPTYISIM